MQHFALSSCPALSHANSYFGFQGLRGLAPLFLALTFAASIPLAAQTADNSGDPSAPQHLAHHHPQWANPRNDLGPLPAAQQLDNLTLVLARTPAQEAAFTQFTRDQQNPASPSYHHWLTPQQVGERFGPSQSQLAAVTSWLQSQNLTVRWTAPSRAFVGFSGTAADLGRALHTELHSYRVQGRTLTSIASEPVIPTALASSIRAIRGLYTIEDRPLHHAAKAISSSPEATTGSGAHFLAPQDFNTIYDVPNGDIGSGQTIGIVGRSRTDFADFDQLRQKTSATFANPTEVVPTAFGGVDPGPAYTAPPSGNVDLGDQLEAELDVLRAGSVAPGANLLLVVATGNSGGIGIDAQYLVQTTPVPANTMNISFGACESQAGPANVNYWDSLFQQAAAEGISVFVSSGDSGASGCDQDFTTPPAAPSANSPNYICSSSYATCVGGTEFNDTANPGAYWNSSNGPVLNSAIGYIPEGAWNEPLNSKSQPQIAASGGGVSSVIPTPDWQTGTGVPSARAGRYTPDLAFSASGHDGYFACFAAAGASCIANSNGEYEFEYFFGTSAAAPSMAAITALLDEKLGQAQGNLNPLLYPLAARSTDAFHDVTVSSSGVASCQASVPSMCNNSAPGTTGLSGGQAGYTINTGYDEVTGLGSLDVGNFLTEFTPALSTPSITVGAASSITSAQDLAVGIQLSGSTTIVPTGTVTVTSGSYSSGPQTLNAGYAYLTIPAATLPAGKDTLTVAYTPDTASVPTYSPVSTSTQVTVTQIAKITPTVAVTLPETTITTAQSLSITLIVNFPSGDHLPTGTVQVASGGYTSGAAKLNGSSNLTYITIPAFSLSAGADTLTATYTPDSGSAPIYNTGTGTADVTVTTAVPVAPDVAVSPVVQSITTAQSLSVSVGVSSSGGPGGTGTVTLQGGSYTSAPTTLNVGMATFTIPAGSLAVGTDTLTANYTPDTNGARIYTSATGTAQVTVTAPPAGISLSATPVTVKAGATTGNTSTVTVTPANGFTGSVALTASITSSPAGVIVAPTFSFGSTTPVSITGTTAGSATLTVTTSAPSSPSCTNASGSRQQASMRTVTGPLAALAAILFFAIPARRRAWRNILGLVLLLAAATAGVTACGSGSKQIACPTVITPGTTTGAYTITVTGASGSLSSSTTFTLTVQ